MTDEDLMQAYINGDIEAFQVLYRRHQGRVLGYLQNRLKDREQAEDVFQEVFAKLHHHRFRYRQEIPFLAWLFTIVKNALIDHLRKQQTQSRYFQATIDEAAGTPTEDATPLPITETFSQLSSLSAKQRKALELRFDQDLSFEDIAAHMNTSQSNARQIISRAVAQLRRLMSAKEV